MKRIILALLMLIVNFTLFSQDYVSAIKGSVKDKHSQFPLTGVRVIIVGSDPLIGTATDFDGDFRLEDLPVGRYTLQFTYLGYKPSTIPNITVKSGKEVDLTVQMEESIEELDEVVVVGTDKKGAQNEMATVSARTISLEEGTRYSGSLQDIARIAQNYAGVSGASDNRNDIIVRGNSPLGVLWRMEDVDIPSPNHFSTLGTTGGPISLLNYNNLANSDFMTSAWSADYGNALSGVFDLKLRNGNKDKREYMGQIGFNGFELGAEGPFRKGGKGSYMANYRYSTLEVFDKIGLDLGTGGSVPNYQDLTFKLNTRNEKLGVFSIWGIGGLSDIFFAANPDTSNANIFTPNTQESDFRSKTAMLGASHLYFFNDKTFSKLSMAYTYTNTYGLIKDVDFDTDTKTLLSKFDRSQGKITAHYKLNRKFNARNTVAIGIIADQYMLNMFDSSLVLRADSIITENVYRKITDINQQTFLLQSYVNWQHRLSDKTTFNVGLHSQHFFLTNSHFIEPRFGFKQVISEKHSLNVGAGIHSQLQPITVYFVETSGQNGTTRYPNQELGFSKSFHSVIGHDFSITKDMRLKTEVYYQRLFDIPIQDTVESSFSMINQGADFTIPNGTGYINNGFGYNYGLEFTLEKFFSKGYYFLVTTSLYESKYKGSDDVERNTLFNGNYVFNTLGGKEFKIGQNQLLAFDAKVTYAGGRRYTPIDFEQSAIEKREIRIYDEAFSEQYDPYFRADFKISYTLNAKKVTQKWALDIQNITNQKNIFITQYDATVNELRTEYQRGFFPIVLYQIYF